MHSRQQALATNVFDGRRRQKLKLLYKLASTAWPSNHSMLLRREAYQTHFPHLSRTVRCSYLAFTVSGSCTNYTVGKPSILRLGFWLESREPSFVAYLLGPKHKTGSTKKQTAMETLGKVQKRDMPSCSCPWPSCTRITTLIRLRRTSIVDSLQKCHLQNNISSNVRLPDVRLEKAKLWENVLAFMNLGEEFSRLPGLGLYL